MYRIYSDVLETSDEREKGNKIIEQKENISLCFFMKTVGGSFLRIPPRNIP